VLEEESATVAGLAVCGDSTPVGKSHKRTDCGSHDPVAGLVIKIRDQAETAVIPLEGRRVKTKFFWSI
jgi:hypothetical protein